MKLSQQQRHFWFDNGFLILPNFIPDDLIQQQIELKQSIWNDLDSKIVVDDLDTSVRLHLNSVPEHLRGGRYKVNDLYLEHDQTRQLSLYPPLVQLLEDLLIDRPVLCNTLDLDYGTMQGFHVDSLYMTPPSPHNLIATWIALEDVDPKAGPLEYIPGSHRLSQFKFSNGSCHVVPSEMDRWDDFMFSQVKDYGLSKEAFMPKKGDVLIWHAYLMHAGSKVLDHNLTRRSLVSHYFVESDCRRLGSDLHEQNGGLWMQRAHQHVPQVDPLLDADEYANAIMNNEKEPSPEIEVNTTIAIENIDPPAKPISLPEAVFRTTLHYARLWHRDLRAQFLER